MNSSGIIIQGNPMVYVNCNMPAPQGTCTHTPIVPMLPDLSKLAPDQNLGGAANPQIASLASGSSSSSGSSTSTGGSSSGSGSSSSSTPTLAGNQWVNPNSIDPANEPDPIDAMLDQLEKEL